MAESATADPNPATSNPQDPSSIPQNPDPASSNPSPTLNPLPPPPSILTPPPPSIQQPSYRPLTPQFVTGPYQTPIPGVMMAPPPGSVAPPQVSAVAPPFPGQPQMRYPPMPNGYMPQGVMHPPHGVPRYPSPYAPMNRPGFPPRPLLGVMPPLARPPFIGIRGPIMPPVVRPPTAAVPSVVEKPQTTVYVGKISSTAENDFMLSLLQLCGPVKSWKRPQDPAGTLKGFGFCEFESAEGVLRALRLLNKLSVDGQELMLNVNQATREYLERFVEKKVESSKLAKVSETEGTDKQEPSAAGVDTKEVGASLEESTKPALDEPKKDESDAPNKENSLGLVTDEDRQADREALEKLTGILEERLISKPLPPPPPPPRLSTDGPGKSSSEQRSESRDRESGGDVAKNDVEDKKEDERTAESKLSSENDKNEPGSPDRSRRNDRSRDRDRDTKKDKERELERYEREREQERSRREKEREYKSREDERRYKVREKEWEAKEREREHRRKREREREKEKAQERKWGIMDQEHDIDDGYSKKRKYKTSDEERRRREREKDDDLTDRLREEEEIAEAKMIAEEEKQKNLHEASTVASSQPANGYEKADLPNDTSFGNQDNAVDQTINHKPSHETYEGEEVMNNGVNDESDTLSNPIDTRQNSNAPTRKLGFGLSGSGKRAAVPSVFKEDEDEDAHKDKKMRPLVPIDYTTEEHERIQPSTPEGPSTNIPASEYSKRMSSANAKEEKADVEKEKVRRSHDRSSHRDRSRHAEENNSIREESKKDSSDRERSNKTKTQETQKLLDAKQLIDTIPKTKDELFSYVINWGVYDQNSLHEKMRPWISKKITEYLGEEEVTLVDYIVSSTQEHADAGEMLERLQTILDDEAEMFVLKMWRMLIFEIKRVENGLAMKSRT